MNNLIAVIFLILLSNAVVTASDWCVVVAGSSSYANYRHQADAAHAYHVCQENGIPTDNIILMMYDDAANSFRNPFPNSLYNDPNNPTNYRDGLTIDYSGTDVTPENFIAVITGDTETVHDVGTGRVLKSTSEDYVFINFVDHGGPGIICFPASNLYADELLDALNKMHDNQMYKKLLFYLEACESGSMFENILPEDINVYAVTAANPSESSWGTFCPPDDVVNGKTLGTCLGDLFSVNWMEDTESTGTGQTLETQFETIVTLTNKSHPMQYGDVSWTDDVLSEFFGTSDSISKNNKKKQNQKNNISTVKSRDIPMHLAYYEYLRHEDEVDFKTKMEKAKKLQQVLSHRIESDMFFYNMAETLSNNDTEDHHYMYHNQPKGQIILDTVDCARNMHQLFEKTCSKFNDYDYRHYKVFINTCNKVGQNIVHDYILKTCDNITTK